MKETSANQDRFKSYLRKIGSGEKSSRGMSRDESADALELILRDKPSPIQIGAFLIAHRIRRPEPQELAGMVDTYKKLGPKIYSESLDKQPVCFGMPFDGRNKTSPIYPLTSLLLLDAGQPVVLQGAGRIPVKYGVTTEELFKALGLNLSRLSIDQVQNGFSQNGFALIYQPDHFPLAEKLIRYREDIGKRPPIASMELLWSAHQGKHIIISGFVHPPTEKRHIKTLRLLGETNLILIKGLEGGIDIPISKICTATCCQEQDDTKVQINPKNYLSHQEELDFKDINIWRQNSLKALEGKGPFYKPLVWNAGVYYWILGITNSIDLGITKAKHSIDSGSAKIILKQLIEWRNKQNN